MLPLLSEDANFFNNQFNQVQWLPISTNGKIFSKINDPSGKIKNIIYIWKDMETNKLLIGKTEATLSGRFAVYKGSLKKGNKVNKSFVNQLKQRPDSFQLGILYKLNSEDNIDDFETRCIKGAKEANYSLYNKNKGGGGGVAHSKKHTYEFYISTDPAQITPKKRYPVVIDCNEEEETKEIKTKVSPGLKRKIKKKQNKAKIKAKTNKAKKLFLYSFKKEDERYIGETIQEPHDRWQQHCYKATKLYNDPTEKPDGKFHAALAKSPQKFSVGVLRIKTQEPKNGEFVKFSTIKDAENYAIGLFNTKKGKGFNVRGGGGGPTGQLFG